MPATSSPDRLAIGSIAIGTAAGLVAFAGLPAFQQYVARVMAGLGGLVPLEAAVPGLALSLAVAFLVGLSMNFLRVTSRS